MTVPCPGAPGFPCTSLQRDVLAGFIMGSGGTGALHGLAADLDLVGCAVAAGAGHAVEPVLAQAVDAYALAKSAEPGDGASFLGG